MAKLVKKKAAKKTKPKKLVKKAKGPAKQRIYKSPKKKSAKSDKKVKVRKTTAKKAKLPNKKRTTKKSSKTRKPSAKQTDKDTKGRFVKGNKAGKKFESGVSGNLSGPPINRIHLWSWFCKFMLMTDAQLKRLVQKKMTQVQHTALRLVKDMKAGKYSGSQHLARHIFDREEGRPVEHLVIEPGDILTDDECEEIREAILKNHAN